MAYKNPEYEAVLEFLKAVDTTFPVPLSEKQNIHEYAYKLCVHGTFCVKNIGDKIVSMVAGYTDRVINGMAYISIIATRIDAQNQGIASALLDEFIEVAKMKKLNAIHVYAVASNIPAIRLYKSHGFIRYEPDGEPRPDDLHLIRYL